MTLFARQDILAHQSTNTGHTHRRPAKKDGTPVPVWGIDCPDCEAELEGHPAWARSRYKIPLTPDEQEEAALAQAAAEQAMHQQQLMLAQHATIQQMAARNAAPQVADEDFAISTGDDSGEDGGDDPAVTDVEGADYSAMTKNDLKELARDRGLVLSGTREDLLARHLEHDQKGTDE
jgi:hypothetical protein